MTPLRVTGLHVYPVKSLAGIEPASARMEAAGLAGDRRWAVVTPDGTKVTAREVHGLLGLRAEPLERGAVRLVDRAGSHLLVDPPRTSEPVPVDFSGQSTALPAAAGVSAWLAERVGHDVRLVWQGEDVVRPIRPDRGGEPGDRNSLSDAAPLHVTTDASLRRLNDWLLETAMERGEDAPAPLRHERFRPNVVVDGDQPFAEDGWAGARIGGVRYRATMECDRCVMTTIDREDLATGKEPIRTLARHRKRDGATWFGIRLTPVLPLPEDATISLGDEVVPT